MTNGHCKAIVMAILGGHCESAEGVSRARGTLSQVALELLESAHVGEDEPRIHGPTAAELLKNLEDLVARVPIPPDPGTTPEWRLRRQERGQVRWFSGLPGAGKTTAAKATGFILLDADIIRLAFDNSSFDEGGRRFNVHNIWRMAKALRDTGYDVAVACIAPFRDQREAFADEGCEFVYLKGGHWSPDFGPNIYEPPED